MDAGPTDTLPDDVPGPGAGERSQRLAGPAASRWLPVARVVWVLLAAAMVALFLWGAALYYRQAATFSALGNFVQESDPQAYRTALRQIGLSTYAYAGLMVGLQLVFMLGSAATGLLIFLKKRDSWWALYLSLVVVSLGASYPTITDALTRAFPGGALLFDLIDRLSLAGFLTLFYLFPDGRFVPPWSRWTTLVLVAVLVLTALIPRNPFDAGILPDVFSLLNFGLAASMVYAQVYRYRHVSGRVERLQTKWVITGMLIALVSLVALGLIPQLFPGLVHLPSRAALYDIVATALLLVIVLVVPLTIGISILRYRLWDIDLIINRTLVYVPLTGIVAGLYSVTLAVTQKLFTAFTGAQSDAAVILSTLLLVTTFTPIKDGVQDFVNRRFKEVPDLRQRLRALNQQMRSFVQLTDETQIAQRTLDEAVAAFQAAGGAVYLERGDGLELACRAGAWDQASLPCVRMSLESGGRRYGDFQLGERHDDLPYSREDEILLQQTGDLLASTIAMARRLNTASAPYAGE
jgi:hypothetical protein